MSQQKLEWECLVYLDRHHLQERDRDCSNEDIAGDKRPPRYFVLNSKTRATKDDRAYMEKTST